jgi:hypothetical protein
LASELVDTSVTNAGNEILVCSLEVIVIPTGVDRVEIGACVTVLVLVKVKLGKVWITTSTEVELALVEAGPAFCALVWPDELEEFESLLVLSAVEAAGVVEGIRIPLAWEEESLELVDTPSELAEEVADFEVAVTAELADLADEELVPTELAGLAVLETEEVPPGTVGAALSPTDFVAESVDILGLDDCEAAVSVADEDNVVFTVCVATSFWAELGLPVADAGDALKKETDEDVLRTELEDEMLGATVELELMFDATVELELTIAENVLRPGLGDKLELDTKVIEDFGLDVVIPMLYLRDLKDWPSPLSQRT